MSLNASKQNTPQPAGYVCVPFQTQATHHVTDLITVPVQQLPANSTQIDQAADRWKGSTFWSPSVYQTACGDRPSDTRPWAKHAYMPFYGNKRAQQLRSASHPCSLQPSSHCRCAALKQAGATVLHSAGVVTCVATVLFVC